MCPLACVQVMKSTSKGATTLMMMQRSCCLEALDAAEAQTLPDSVAKVSQKQSLVLLALHLLWATLQNSALP